MCFTRGVARTRAAPRPPKITSTQGVVLMSRKVFAFSRLDSFLAISDRRKSLNIECVVPGKRLGNMGSVAATKIHNTGGCLEYRSCISILSSCEKYNKYVVSWRFQTVGNPTINALVPYKGLGTRSTQRPPIRTHHSTRGCLRYVPELHACLFSYSPRVIPNETKEETVR